MALRLVLNRDGVLDELADALGDVRRDLCACSRCGSVTQRSEDPCRLCTAANRDDALLCVVEEPGDILLIERSGGYRGRYHALMGKLSPMRGEGPRELRVKELLERVRGEGFREVVLALSTDVEGDSTAGYVAELLREAGVSVTRLAFGLPARSGVAYSDPVTLARAFEGRREA
jgi:recombination protein RecR